ncbi:Uncharacterised protein [Nocardia farcinica]|uniref:hypothetical protein n=1 Tax=Nocardia farcinica TaxID=37329 RepID=UPI0010266841|nr:hypothetical protein [Nocardia farcinica]VFA96152.1 Uncharacterised protein [Nocardia farcinica]
MSMPNPVNPDDHGEEIVGLSDEQRQAELESLRGLAADMQGTKAEQLAAQLLVPVVPDGGTLGRTVAPHVDRASKARDWARIWGPAIATTAAAGAAVAVLPLPGPLALYVLALAAFAWWHCAGRPGAVETVQMCWYAAADTGAWIRRHVEHLAARRARYETRRTTTETH